MHKYKCVPHLLASFFRYLPILSSETNVRVLFLSFCVFFLSNNIFLVPTRISIVRATAIGIFKLLGTVVGLSKFVCWIQSHCFFFFLLVNLSFLCFNFFIAIYFFFELFNLVGWCLCWKLCNLRSLLSSRIGNFNEQAAVPDA